MTTTHVARVREKEAEQAKAKILEIFGWVMDLNMDVDPCVFREECYSAAVLAAQAVGARLPACVRRHGGVMTLDFACAMMGIHVPDIIRDSRLSGASELRCRLQDEGEE